MSVRAKQWLMYFLVSVIIFCSIIGYVAVQSHSTSKNIGCSVVKLMYEFEDPLYLGPNYTVLKELLSEDMWRKLNIDELNRVVNSYYKFGNTASTVEFVYIRDGFIVYRLHNPNIPERTLWVFSYEIVDGKVDNIKEYRLVSVYAGEEGWFG